MCPSVPHLGYATDPIYKLLKANVELKRDDQCNKTFEEGKQKLMEAPVLAHYNPTRSLKLATDASAYGIGALLLHYNEDGTWPIAFTSRTLTAAEKNYAQIDKEALALIYAVQECHVYRREGTLGVGKFGKLSAKLPLVKENLSNCCTECNQCN